MKIRLLCVGKLRNPALALLCEQYIERLRRYGGFEVREVRAARGASPEAAVAEESGRLEKALDGQAPAWVLDEGGRAWSSPQWAARLEALEGRGVKRLTVVLGGAYGLDERVRKRGELVSLSKLTFPHELCRLLALEQLYRARTIQRGEPYHHG